jgi:hypothetical protein
MRDAAALPTPAVAQRLHGLGCALVPDLTEEACCHGRVATLQWLISKGCGWGRGTLKACSGKGDMALFDKCLAAGCPFFKPLGSWGWESYSELDCALFGWAECFRKGNLKPLEKLIEKGVPVTLHSLNSLVNTAAIRGLVHVLAFTEKLPLFEEWRKDKKAVTLVLCKAVSANSLECVRWALAVLFGEGTALVPEERGKLEMPGGDLLDHQTVQLQVDILAALAPFYDLSGFWSYVLRSLNADACRFMASQGYNIAAAASQKVLLGILGDGPRHLPFLRVLVQECGLILADVAPDTTLCTTVARTGSGELMRFVREQGCKWDESVLTVAARYNRIPLMRWIKQQEPSWSWPKDLIKEALDAYANEAAEYVKEQVAVEAAKPSPGKNGSDDHDVDDGAPQGPPAAKRARIEGEGAGGGRAAPETNQGYRY